MVYSVGYINISSSCLFPNPTQSEFRFQRGQQLDFQNRLQASSNKIQLCLSLIGIFSGLLASVKGQTFADSGVVLSQVFIPSIQGITLGISKVNGLLFTDLLFTGLLCDVTVKTVTCSNQSLIQRSLVWKWCLVMLRVFRTFLLLGNC